MIVVRKIKRYMTFLSLVLVFVAILSTDARAVIYDSWMVVENNSGIPGQVAGQLSVEVTPSGDDVLFKFINTGSLDFFIADIYFDDGALLGIASIDNTDPDVSFSAPATPGNLPGGSAVSPPFVTSTSTSAGHFSADADPTVADNGVGPGDYVGIVFDIGSNTFANVIDALNVGFNPDTYYYLNSGSGAYDGWDLPSLRIGIHVQGIDNLPLVDKSDTYILTPVPGAVLLGLLGLSVAGMKLRKFA